MPCLIYQTHQLLYLRQDILSESIYASNLKYMAAMKIMLVLVIDGEGDCNKSQLEQINKTAV